MIFLMFPIVFILTMVFTGIIKKYALAKHMLDMPNFRSSHKVPTPRGGGLAFVVVFLSSLVYLIHINAINFRGGYWLLTSLFLVSGIGLYDDLMKLKVHRRFIGQVFASFIAICAIGFFPDIDIYSFTLKSGYIVTAIAIIYLVWLLNLYNFMDGIDSLASLEAISVCLGISIIYWLDGHLSLMIVPLILAMAISGFLYWNIPPARIFMGDVGSGFLGFIFGILSLQAWVIDSSFFWSYLILLGVFIVDATVTLIYRVLQREKIYLAHCSHAYQHAARLFKSHLLVARGALVLNIIWLWPIAILVGLKYIDGFFGLVIAYIPLVVLAIQFNAGKSNL